MPLIVKSRFVPKHTCVNLFGILWSQDKSWIDKKIINHEKIHTRQEIELLFVPFYILYILEYLVRLFFYRNHRKAYLNISFEREAYTHGDNLDYLKNRKLFSWIKFI